MELENAMKKLSMTLPIIVASALLGACATTGSGYSRNDLHAEASVQYGVIESVRPVNVDGTHSGIGAGAGALLGGLAGSQIGHGAGSAAGAVVGAVAGGLGGNYLENRATSTHGYEIVVHLRDQRTISVVQGEGYSLRPGDRVRVVTGADGSRVERS
jgi:outer membrane lipoprotein SlyB